LPTLTGDERVRRAVGGDSDALSELLCLAGPELERSLRIGRRWQAHIDVDDVLQVTYLEAFMQIRCFEPDRGVPFVRWLRRIAANNLRDALRGVQRHVHRSVERPRSIQPGEDSVVCLYDLLVATTTSPTRQYGRGELHQALEQALALLPPDYAAVVRQYDLEGRSIDEVAAALGRSRGAVHMLRARAHERLRESLETASLYLSSGA
jgi:RNA polymerase sigma-70 factor (ECF subfamily)